MSQVSRRELFRWLNRYNTRRRKPPSPERICPVCGESFVPTVHNQVFCPPTDEDRERWPGAGDGWHHLLDLPSRPADAGTPAARRLANGAGAARRRIQRLARRRPHDERLRGLARRGLRVLQRCGPRGSWQAAQTHGPANEPRHRGDSQVLRRVASPDHAVFPVPPGRAPAAPGTRCMTMAVSLG